MANRVAYFTSEFPRATDTFIRREIEALREVGVEVVTYALHRPEDSEMVSEEQERFRSETRYVFPIKPLDALDAQARMIGDGPVKWGHKVRAALSQSRPGAVGHAKQSMYFLEASILSRMMIEDGIEHVHAHFGDVATSVASIAAISMGVPYSFTLHGPGVFFGAYEWKLGEKVAGAKFVSCISHFCRSQARFLAGSSHADKLFIVHCGVSPQLYSSEQSIDPSPLNRIKLVSVGRLDEIKGVGDLIEAVVRVANRGIDIELDLVGDGPKRSEYERAVSEGRFGDRIRFHGSLSQSEVASVLGESDAFVSASYAEGVPVVIMEAMASGLPTIATQVGGVSELVEHGNTGLIVPPSDVDSLVKAISLLAGDPELRRSMGQKGRRVVQSDFDSRIEARRLASLFRSEDGFSGIDTRPAA